MAEVFISYSSVDSIQAEDVVRAIENAGINCWASSRDIPPGADYAVEIPKAITACKFFVLLLSNAAQESPYVMLELDQAFKQKKEILPILLEPIEETEKTNFFLNAKQKLDATNDLTSAVNTAIQRIRSKISNSQIVIGQIVQNNQIDYQQSKAINQANRQLKVHCPTCGCSILKRKRLTFDRCFYPKQGKPSRDEVIKAWINSSVLIAFLLLFFMVFFLVSIFVAVLMSELCTKLGFTLPQGDDFGSEVLPFIVLAISAGISMSLIWFICNSVFKDPSCGIPINLIEMFLQSMNNSGLKLYSFKCMKCENYFSVLLPDNEELKDMVPDLLEDANEE